MEVVVKGAQDVLLTGNPDKSPYRHLYKRSSPFALCDYKSYFEGGNLTLFKRGDLLSKCYLMLEDFKGKTVIPAYWDGLFDTVELYIGDQLIDSQDYTYSSCIWPALESDNLSQSAVPGTFYPLRFFFCNSWSSALPIAGIKCHDVRFRITNPSKNYRFVMWQTFINLGDDERAMIPSEIVITQVQRVLTAGKTNYSELIGPVSYLAAPLKLVLTYNSSYSFTTSGPVSFTISSSYAPVTWSYTPASLPAGMSVSATTGSSITFSIAALTNISTFNLNVTAAPFSGLAASTGPISVYAVYPNLAAPSQSYFNTISVAKSFTVVSTPPTSPITFTGLVDGMTQVGTSGQVNLSVGTGFAQASITATTTGYSSTSFFIKNNLISTPVTVLTGVANPVGVAVCAGYTFAWSRAVGIIWTPALSSIPTGPAGSTRTTTSYKATNGREPSTVYGCGPLATDGVRYVYTIAGEGGNFNTGGPILIVIDILNKVVTEIVGTGSWWSSPESFADLKVYGGILYGITVTTKNFCAFNVSTGVNTVYNSVSPSQGGFYFDTNGIAIISRSGTGFIGLAPPYTGSTFAYLTTSLISGGTGAAVTWDATNNVVYTVNQTGNNPPTYIQGDGAGSWSSVKSLGTNSGQCFGCQFYSNTLYIADYTAGTVTAYI